VYILVYFIKIFTAYIVHNSFKARAHFFTMIVCCGRTLRPAVQGRSPRTTASERSRPTLGRK